MTTATTLTHPTGQHPIRSSGMARAGAALVVILVAGLGVWGAIATTQSTRSHHETKVLQSAVEQARHSLALERSALRVAATPGGHEAFAAAASSFDLDLRHIAANGTGDDAARARLLRGSHALMVAALGSAIDTSGRPATVGEIRRLDERRAALDTDLSSLLEDVRGRSSGAWQDRIVEKLALSATGLLIVVGLATCAIFLLRLAGYPRRLERLRDDELARLEWAALTDSLTGLGNHRAFHEDMARELARCASTGSQFTVVMLDLDGLKEINDTLGHRAGDERLRAVADCLGSVCRTGGAYRTGGDEFMVILPDERAWGGLTFAQRLQTEIEHHRTAVRVSCGIAETSGRESAEALVHRADLALYEAKRSARANVVYSAGLAAEPTAAPEEIASRRQQRLLATALAQAVDAKDPGTRSHCETVAELCVLIGHELGLSEQRIERIRVAGLLHDVGKIGIDDAVLRKPGGLDPDERSAMSCHVRMGQSIVAAAGFAQEAEWILMHHERLDGSGYPTGLSGSAIPLESRIIQVADAFEAITANRPYRPARRPAEAFDELELGVGTQFDATCVAALRSALGSGVSTAERWFAPADDTSAHPLLRAAA